MVDTYSRWIEEPDYTNFPKEKMCDYDEMAVWIHECGYVPKTTMENLITIIFLHFEGAMENKEGLYFSIENCKEYVEASGGLSEFDYET